MLGKPEKWGKTRYGIDFMKVKKPILSGILPSKLSNGLTSKTHFAPVITRTCARESKQYYHRWTTQKEDDETDPALQPEDLSIKRPPEPLPEMSKIATYCNNSSHNIWQRNKKGQGCDWFSRFPFPGVLFVLWSKLTSGRQQQQQHKPDARPIVLTEARGLYKLVICQDESEKKKREGKMANEEAGEIKGGGVAQRQVNKTVAVKLSDFGSGGRNSCSSPISSASKREASRLETLVTTALANEKRNFLTADGWMEHRWMAEAETFAKRILKTAVVSDFSVYFPAVMPTLWRQVATTHREHFPVNFLLWSMGLKPQFAEAYEIIATILSKATSFVTHQIYFEESRHNFLILSWTCIKEGR
ncbi:hypothetical protein LSTR_LSTR008889 [Laodelphax striatellus]|uniref:Uncharacterized protein n=1 Tax=Laodelphax striatellus TaxID=195883 RepID=A0A482WM18_LAOST|nr:hypothetical protein LSTR_LSTR008889 [Laodelphax striatellus]